MSKISLKDWQSVGLSTRQVAEILGTYSSNVSTMGMRINENKVVTITHIRLRHLLDRFPEKKGQLLSLFKEKLGDEAVEKIISDAAGGKIISLKLGVSYEEKYYTLIFDFMTKKSQASGETIVECIKGVCTDLGIPTEDALQAISANINR